jgi:hypothetical protein
MRLIRRGMELRGMEFVTAAQQVRDGRAWIVDMVGSLGLGGFRAVCIRVCLPLRYRCDRVGNWTPQTSCGRGVLNDHMNN